MLNWIIENLSTIIVCAVLIVAVAAIIAGLVLRKKHGKSSCGCGCSTCGVNDCCGKPRQS